MRLQRLLTQRIQTANGFKDALGIELTGPFDVLPHTKPAELPTPSYLHARSFYDPPEVITLMRQNAKTFGYFRDDPKQTPKYVVEGSVSNGSFGFSGASLTEVLTKLAKEAPETDSTKKLLEVLPAPVIEAQPGPPSPKRRRGASRSQVTSRGRQRGRKVTHTDQDGNQVQVERLQFDTRPRNITHVRLAEVIGFTVSGLGIAVPTKEITAPGGRGSTVLGFRDLPLTGQALSAFLESATSRGPQLDDLITRATIACDECDFGTTLQLGLDLWTQGVKFENEALGLLESAYMMLGRSAFGKLARLHVQHRRRQLQE
ncbi:hypothetical protein LEN26_002341 [Aphanomyces euteiches]|nr:hypothetical protein AeMF1_005514 [Aphanomyces euteiches]KAH9159431.1 hypothetical protein LEN26_002341 [Aphanomyces euteiches]KAH9188076.1 hypothetical protein AeNC1_009942 [Aphanomyces euteiches]